MQKVKVIVGTFARRFEIQLYKKEALWTPKRKMLFYQSI